MKFDWRLGLVAAAAALSLQACDVQVHSNAGSTTVQQPQASLPEDAKLNEQQTAAVTPPPPAVDTSAAPAPAPEAAASAALPVPETTAEATPQPDTSALGAAAATPPAASTATASAAPTELQRFFETNSPAAKAEKAAAKK